MTQDVLVKLATGALAARDADAFRGWIYRVSLRSALNAWHRRAAIRLREMRSAMDRPASAPLDDRERLALFEAMDGLDDRERSLLLEHYFEKVPLADLGARRGVSAVAIWKRIDRAREKLKKSLLGAGFAAASARVADALESAVPAVAPPALSAEEVLSKILAGGIAVGSTKTSSLLVSVVAIFLLLGASIGGYHLLRSRESRDSSANPQAITVGKRGASAEAVAIPVAAPPASVPLQVPPIAEDRKSTRLNSSHRLTSRMPSSA